MKLAKTAFGGWNGELDGGARQTLSVGRAIGTRDSYASVSSSGTARAVGCSVCLRSAGATNRKANLGFTVVAG